MKAILLHLNKFAVNLLSGYTFAYKEIAHMDLKKQFYLAVSVVQCEWS